MLLMFGMSQSEYYFPLGHITESRPLKHIGQEKWDTQDALCAHKDLPLFLVPIDLKNQNS